MSVKSTRVCDECGKEKAVDSGDFPPEWFRLSVITLGYWNKQGDCNTINQLRIGEGNGDPDFCSEKCAIEWFKKALKGIKVEQPEY